MIEVYIKRLHLKKNGSYKSLYVHIGCKVPGEGDIFVSGIL